jgi:hypothetical protein
MPFFDFLKTDVKLKEKKAEAKTTERITPARSKPAEVNTQTGMYTKSTRSILADQAKRVADSKVVTVTGKGAAGAVIIGGGVYLLGQGISGGVQGGMSGLGYGYRSMIGANTTQDKMTQDLNNQQKAVDINKQQLDLLKNYQSFLSTNGLSDSPSTRGVYDQYLLGQNPTGNGTTDNKTTSTGSGISPLWIAAGVAVLGVGAFIALKKNKGKK